MKIYILHVYVFIESDCNIFGLDDYLEDDDDENSVDEHLDSVMVSSLESRTKVYTVPIMRKDEDTKSCSW